MPESKLTKIGYSLDDVGIKQSPICYTEHRKDVNPFITVCEREMYPIFASPMESVVDGKTGSLLDNENPEKWADKMNEMLSSDKYFDNTSMNNDELRAVLNKHVEDYFSLSTMKTDLFNEVQDIFPKKKLKSD